MSKNQPFWLLAEVDFLRLSIVAKSCFGHKTQQQHKPHTQQQPTWAAATLLVLSGTLPSLSRDRAEELRFAQVCTGRKLSGLHSPASVHLFGRQNGTHQKEVGRGQCLRWVQFVIKTQQWNDSLALEKRWGQVGTCVDNGGRRTIARCLGRQMNRQIIEKWVDPWP